MAISMQDLFASLQAGDLLLVPIALPSDGGRQIISYVSVLRVEGEALHLSYPNTRFALATAYKGHNPFRWDPTKNTLVDKNGDVPRWYSIHICRERGGAATQAAVYASVPRLEQVKPEHKFDDAAFRQFLRQDPRVAQLDGIVRNGEAGQATWQLALALDVMGVEYTQEQLVGLAWFIEMLASHQKMVAIHETLASLHDSQDQSARALLSPST